MKKKSFYLLSMFTVLFFASCTSYTDKNYGPVSYETAFEFPFEGPNEAMVTVPFTPEEFDISKETVGGMKLKTITLNTTHPEGFGIFDNLKIDVLSDNTEALTIGVLNEVPDGNSVTIQGLESAKIENFNTVDEFYLLIEGNLTKGSDEDIPVTGEFTLSVESSQE
jgi:hypothetical protein